VISDLGLGLYQQE